MAHAENLEIGPLDEGERQGRGEPRIGFGDVDVVEYRLLAADGCHRPRLEHMHGSLAVDGPLHVLRPAQGFGQVQRDSREREHLVVVQRGLPGLLGLLERGAAASRGDDAAPLGAHDPAVYRPGSGVDEEGVTLDRSRDDALAEPEPSGDDRLRHVAGLRVTAEDDPGDRAVDQHLHDYGSGDLVAG